MPTVVTSTIAGTSPDYATVTLWEADTDNDLVAADEQHQGLVRATTTDDSPIISGATVDSTRYRSLEVDLASGATWPFEAGEGALTNSVINPVFGTGEGITVAESYFVLDGFEITDVTDTSGNHGVFITGGSNITIKNCLIYDLTGQYTDGIGAWNISTSVTVINCIIYNCERGCIHAENWSSGTTVTQTWNIYNCTLDVQNGVGGYNGGVLVRASNADSVITTNIKNCLINGPSIVQDTASTLWTANVDNTICGDNPAAEPNTYNATGVTVSATFTTSTAASAVIFVDLTPGGEDYHLVDHANNLAIDYGANLSGTFTDDAEADARPGSGAWDAGADELPAAAEKEGTGAITLPVPTMDASGTRTGERTGEGSITLPTPTMEASGTKGKVGESEITLPLPTISGTGHKVRVGEGEITLPLPTISGAGERTGARTATSAMSLPLPTMSASGVKVTAQQVRRFLVNVDITGTLAVSSGITAASAAFTGAVTAASAAFTGALTAASGIIGTSTGTADGTLQIHGNPAASQTDTLGLALVNATAATAGAQKYSTAARWEGQGWKTNATAASMPVEARAYLIPIQGTAAPSSLWTLESSINGAAYTSLFSCRSDGVFFLGNTTSMLGGSTTGLYILGDITGRNNDTNATTKSTRFKVSSYTNSEEDVVILSGTSSNGANNVYFGGGSSIFNCATNLFFFTAANQTTLTGTEVARMTVAGTVFQIGVTANALTPLHARGNAASTKPVATIEQLDDDDVFINFVGTSAADATKSISTLTVATIAGYTKDEINGTPFWRPYYNAPTA